MWSLVLRGSLGYRAEQAAELATQGARGLALFAEGRSGRRNVDFLTAGPPHTAAGCSLLPEELQVRVRVHTGGVCRGLREDVGGTSTALAAPPL